MPDWLDIDTRVKNALNGVDEILDRRIRQIDDMLDEKIDAIESLLNRIKVSVNVDVEKPASTDGPLS